MELTKEWQPYNGHYQKAIQDIILSNGEIVTYCWPNAGFWNCMKKKGNEEYYNKEIPHMEAKRVRLTHDNRWS